MRLYGRKGKYIRSAGLWDQRSRRQRHWRIDVHRHGTMKFFGYHDLISIVQY